MRETGVEKCQWMKPGDRVGMNDLFYKTEETAY